MKNEKYIHPLLACALIILFGIFIALLVIVGLNYMWATDGGIYLALGGLFSQSTYKLKGVSRRLLREKRERITNILFESAIRIVIIVTLGLVLLSWAR